jgi:hypothetical protein
MRDNQIKTTGEPNQVSPWLRFFLSRPFPLLWIFMGIIGLYVGGNGIYQAKESAEWPSTNGVVQTSKLEFRSTPYDFKSKGKGIYHAKIVYQFHVKEQTYRGTQIAFGDFDTSDPSHAQQIVTRYPKGKTVKVYYRDSDPDICVLEPGIQARAWFFPTISLVFCVIGILMVIFFPKLLKKKQTEDEELTLEESGEKKEP